MLEKNNTRDIIKSNVPKITNSLHMIGYVAASCCMHRILFVTYILKSWLCLF